MSEKAQQPERKPTHDGLPTRPHRPINEGALQKRTLEIANSQKPVKPPKE